MTIFTSITYPSPDWPLSLTLRVQGFVSRSLLNLRLNLRDFEIVILVLNTICFESKTL